MSSMQIVKVIPTWACDIDYQEGDVVIKDGLLCSYWRYPKTGELVWLSVENCHQYNMFVCAGQEVS